MHHLLFQISEGSDGIATLDAQASSREAGTVARIRAEAQALLDWAAATFPEGPGPVEDGADWDHALDEQTEPGGCCLCR